MEKKNLVVLGKGWRQGLLKRLFNQGKLDLSLESKITILAAVELFRQGHINNIIISGGKTAGDDWPAEAEAMKSYLLEEYPEIPHRSIIIEVEAIDTFANARGARQVIEKYGLKEDLLLLTVGYHLPRAKKIFSKFDLTGKWLASENVLFHSKSQLLARDYINSARCKRGRIKEKALMLILRFDRAGYIQRCLSRILSGRLLCDERYYLRG